MVLEWFYSLQAVGTTLLEVHALYRTRALLVCGNFNGQNYCRCHIQDFKRLSTLCCNVSLWLVMAESCLESEFAVCVYNQGLFWCTKEMGML